MAYVHLNAREWLESQRLQGCLWAPELLDLIDGQEKADLNAMALEWIGDAIKRDPDFLTERERMAFEEAVTDRLHLLESLEEVLAEFSEGFTCANGTRPVDPDDLLREMFKSSRWQKYDL
jgi:hypothetical protein